MSSIASTYLPVLTSKLLDDSASEDVRKAAIEALKPLDPVLLCDHAVPAVLTLLKQWIEAAELMLPVVNLDWTYAPSHLRLKVLTDASCCRELSSARPQWAKQQILCERELHDLFALVKGCEALDAHVPHIVRLILHQAKEYQEHYGFRDCPSILDFDADPNDEDYNPSEDGSEDPDDKDEDIAELFTEPLDRMIDDEDDDCEILTEEAAEALSQTARVQAGKEVVLSRFRRVEPRQQQVWLDIIEDISKSEDIADTCANLHWLTNELLTRVRSLLDQSNDRFMCDTCMAAGILYSWLSEVEEDDNVARWSYSTTSVQSNGTRAMWMHLAAIHVTPHPKRVAPMSSAEPPIMWLSEDLVAEMAELLLSTPADASALSCTSKVMHRCVAPLLQDAYVMLRGHIQTDCLGNRVNGHRRLMRALLLKLLANARPASLACHTEELTRFLHDDDAAVQCAAIHLFGRAMQNE